ncbi:MAG: phosphatidate cytidylyltransferase [Tissierellia bacterium]|nr:phosphatidate cytidylyltransferase [Tissierellia bacterium]
MKGLITRTISGFMIVLLTIAITIKGGMSLSYFTMALSILGLREFYNAMNEIKIEPIKYIGYLSCIGILLNPLEIKWAHLRLIFFIAMVVISFIRLFFKKDITPVDILITFLGILYIPFLLRHIIYLDGNIYIWLIYINAWGTDTFAYIFGTLFGKNKLCPRISPNKTIEGSLGGIFGAVLLSLGFARYFSLSHLWKLVLLAITGGIIAQLGDLTASRIKRVTGIKDFGFIMPGHGGILDRFDSILFTAPFVYYYTSFFLL